MGQPTRDISKESIHLLQKSIVESLSLLFDCAGITDQVQVAKVVEGRIR